MKNRVVPLLITLGEKLRGEQNRYCECKQTNLRDPEHNRTDRWETFILRQRPGDR